MKRIVAGALILLFVTGCSYTGSFERGFHLPDTPLTSKINLSVALINTPEIRDYRFQELIGGRALTFYINPAFNEELAKELQTIFSDVQITEPDRKLGGYDIKIIPALNLKYVDGNAWGGQYKYEITTTLVIWDAKFDTVIDEFQDTQELIIAHPAGTIVLGVITGLSLFILSPITIPLQMQITGNHVTKVLENGISKSFKVLSYQVAHNPNIYNLNK